MIVSKWIFLKPLSFYTQSKLKMVNQKTKIDSLVGLEDLCAIIIYFNSCIHILQPRQPEVKIAVGKVRV